MAVNVTFRQADAEDMPFKDESFDLVTCRIVPHHFTDCTRFVGEGTRVLKTGGLLLVQDHALPEDKRAARYVDTFERLRDPSHNRAYAETKWVDMFQTAGPTVEHAERVIKRHEFIPWAECQDCTSEMVQRLVGMVKHAPRAVPEWMRPRDLGTPEATFINYHILIAGRKS